MLVQTSPLSVQSAEHVRSRVSAPVVVGITGTSDSGKTTLAVELIREFSALSARIRVAVIKHCPHGHDLDLAGSDTERIREAGADSVVASSPGSIATFSTTPDEIELDTLIDRLTPDHDVVLVEGHKTSSLPKMLVTGDDPLSIAPRNIVATVGLSEPGAFGPPNFASFETRRLAEWILSNPALRRDNQAVSLRVDGVPVNMKKFPSAALRGVVSGFVDSLRRIPEGYGRIDIRINFTDPEA